MRLFGKKKEEKKEESCCCGGACDTTEETKDEGCCCGSNEEKTEESCCCASNEETKEESCCCGGQCNEESVEAANKATAQYKNVMILGSGCAKCNQLEANTKDALAQMGMDDEVMHITDFGQIAAMGVMSTPALVIDSKVVSMGKVLTSDEVLKIIKKVR